MKKIRMISLILVVLILGMFLVMSGALLMQNYNLFFISGSVLIALLIVAFVLLRAYRNKSKKDAEEALQDESDQTSPEEEE